MNLASLRHHYSNLTRFSGRDRPGQFWPSALLHMGVLFAGWAGLVAWSMATLEAGVRLMPILVTVIIAGGFVLTLLFASAVTRRLHDVGLSGRWAMIPAVLYIASGALMLGFFTAGHNETAGFSPFFLAGWLVTMLYNITVLALIIVLCLPSQRKENRFGPPPSPTA